MPFMIGTHPIRFTLKYLEAGQLIFKESVKIFSINYNYKGDNHVGAKEFVHWNLCQVQYKNPNVQCVTFKNMTPTPFMKFYFDNGDEILVDVDGKTKEEISAHLKRIVCKSDEQLQYEAQMQIKKENPANFGNHCERQCICKEWGQVPCSGFIPLPKHWMAKYQNQNE